MLLRPLARSSLSSLRPISTSRFNAATSPGPSSGGPCLSVTLSRFDGGADFGSLGCGEPVAVAFGPRAISNRLDGEELHAQNRRNPLRTPPERSHRIGGLRVELHLIPLGIGVDGPVGTVPHLNGPGAEG